MQINKGFSSMTHLSIPQSLKECREIDPVAHAFLIWSDRVRQTAVAFLILSVAAGLLVWALSEEFLLFLAIAGGGLFLMPGFFAFALFLEGKGTMLAYTAANAMVSIYECSKNRNETETVSTSAAKKTVGTPQNVNSKCKKCPQCGASNNASRNYCEMCGSQLL